ncbi:7271_t:CDS:2 [Cetraspora pellucida]|uniref:7271_t:CDS:1 n=1 Tax=Cetraspora pellucida TaxID=1433469 RepID=A0A9N9GYI7_9GLOM|nr:7271_t:CDS:2 [Cetraspora pellucida]
MATTFYSDNGHLVLKKPNINAIATEIILKYLYCGVVDFNRQKKEIILELLVAADELGVQRLINSVQDFLVQNCYKFLQSDLMKMLNFITCHNSFDILKKACLKSLTKNCKDFLRKDPINILHFIIHHETFHELRKVTLDAIYFMFDVWPFRHLLPDNLIEDILRCYLVSTAIPLYHGFPARSGNVNLKIDSVLINKKIALLFTKWIDKKSIDDENSRKFHSFAISDYEVFHVAKIAIK